MNRVKIILGYILGFICAALVAIISLLLILKFTVYNKDYLKSILDKNGYYDKVSVEILDNMKNYMVSSGLPENILDDIYTNVEIKEDINNFIDSMYEGKKTNFDMEPLKNKLSNNIDNYLLEHDVKVTSKSYIDSFINEIGKIYENEVNLYGNFNGVINTFNKSNDLVNSVLIVLSIILIILSVILFILRVNYFGSVLSAGGLILLFIRLVIMEKVDFNNILVISENFSFILRFICNKIGNLVLFLGFGLIVSGLLFIIKESFNKNTLKKDK